MNPLIAEIPPSLIRTIAARKRPGDIDLGLGEPTIPPSMQPFEAALEWTRENGSPYSPNAGLPELRGAIAAYVGGYSGRDVDTARVCVTVGSEEALFLAIKTVVEPARDEVLVVEPCYLAYPKICLLEGIRHRMVPLDGATGFAPAASRVLEAVRDETRLIVLNSPSNPTGRVWPERELRELATGLERIGRPDVFILSDEVYRELYFQEEPPGSIAAHHERTLVASSLSKSNSLTGLRLGWLWGPPEVIAAATKVHQFVNTAASTFSQRVALNLVSEPARLGAFRQSYVESRQALLATCDEYGIAAIPPEGAFYAFLRLPVRLAEDSLVAAERLLADFRVVAVPGAAFGDSGEGWLRISWVAPPDRVRVGLQRIADFFGSAG